MTEASPYVVLVTGPSAGVGKSTLATNLAVYLKALDEELPVAYASLEPDADVDAMFRLGKQPEYSLFDLQRNIPFVELFTLGQFGVEYCAAVNVGQQSETSQSLRKGLAQADFPGVLILDAAGDSPFLPAALAAVDLLLVPVKDPAALPEIVRLQKGLLAAAGERQQLWLLPSQLGAASRYQPSAALTEFLRFAAQERGFQVLEGQFSADSRVAELAVKFAKPVLTRVPQSALHQQLKQLAELLLDQRQRQTSFSVRVRRMLLDGLLPPRARRIALSCPLCKCPALSGEVHYLEAFPARRRMLLHRDCVTALLVGTAAAAFHGEPGLTLVQSGTLFGGGTGQLRLQVLAEDLELLNTEMVEVTETSVWHGLIQTATGRCLAEIYRELVVYSEPVAVSELLSDAWYRDFVARRGALRQACREEKI